MKSLSISLIIFICASFLIYACETVVPAPVVNNYYTDSSAVHNYDTIIVNITDSSSSSSAGWLAIQPVYPDSIINEFRVYYNQGGTSVILKFDNNREETTYLKLLENTYTLYYDRMTSSYPTSIQYTRTFQVFAGDTTVLVLP